MNEGIRQLWAYVCMFLVFWAWGSLALRALECRLEERSLALRVTTGLLAAYVIALLIPQLSLHRPLIAIGALIGFRLELKSLRPRSSWSFLGFGVSLLWASSAVLAAAILRHPDLGWDAQSIWFFHAKLIFFAKTTAASAGFSLPEIAFSHVDYPRLNALLSAEWLETTGLEWSEGRAKASLAILLACGTLGVQSLGLRSWRKSLMLIGLLFWLPAARTLSGYMDVWCCAFGLLALLHLSRGGGVFQGLVFVLLSAQVKNEGLLIALAILITGFFLKALNFKPAFGGWLGWFRRLAFLGVGLCWPWVQFRNGYRNDLGLTSLGFVRQVFHRLTDPEAVWFILKWIFFGPSLLIVAFLAAIWIVYRPGAMGASRWVFWAGAVYLGGVLWIFLGTPSDLSWHLGTSASRVTLFVSQAWIMSVIAPTLTLFGRSGNEKLANL